MQAPVSEVRRRARYHALRGRPPEHVTQGVARARRFLVLLFQVGALGFLAVRGFPWPRLLVHAAVCLFYLSVSRYPTPPTERAKMRMLIGGLLSFGVWVANTGALSSPLIPLGLGMLLPALLVFDTRKQLWFFAGGALAVLS